MQTKTPTYFRIFMRVRAYVRAWVILLKGGGKANYKGNAGVKSDKININVGWKDYFDNIKCQKQGKGIND